MDLSLVSMEDLWEELRRRNEAVLLVRLQALDDETDRTFVWYSGGRTTCIGLACYAKIRIEHDQKKGFIEEDKEES